MSTSLNAELNLGKVSLDNLPLSALPARELSYSLLGTRPCALQRDGFSIENDICNKGFAFDASLKLDLQSIWRKNF
jgi:hypothetical protein